MRTLLVMFLVIMTTAARAENPVKIVSWNIANLHHVDGEPLRGGAQPRDKEDYDRLADFAALIDAQIFALQEIGSPAAARRIFPESDYHLFISDRYKPGDENRPPERRDIYTAFAISKEAFPQAPDVSTMTEFSIANIEINSAGKAVNRPTRAGMLLPLDRDGKRIQILNLHLKSSCHGNSLQPVFDERRDGRLNGNRYDCRTLAAQGMMLENWIEQQRHLGNSVLVLGDLNRRLNSLDNVPNKNEHFWRDLNDGSPNGLVLHKGPLGKNTNCWANNNKLFFDEHIDFLIFDDSLSSMIDAGDIEKVALPHQNDPKYSGRAGQKLSDHCPVAGVLN